MEGEIPDILARDILEKDVRPKVNTGDFSGAIEGYFNRVMNRKITDSTQIPSSSPNSPIAS